MAKIGNFGKSIIFETNDKKILNFTNFTKEVSGRWGSHERYLKKPKKQFLGPDAGQITFDIKLNATLGVKPRTVLKKIESLVEKGIAERLVIGGKAVGSNKWVITKCSSTWDTILNKGELLKASLSLTLEEYL